MFGFLVAPVLGEQVKLPAEVKECLTVEIVAGGRNETCLVGVGKGQRFRRNRKGVGMVQPRFPNFQNPEVGPVSAVVTEVADVHELTVGGQFFPIDVGKILDGGFLQDNSGDRIQLKQFGRISGVVHGKKLAIRKQHRRSFRNVCRKGGNPNGGFDFRLVVLAGSVGLLGGRIEITCFRVLASGLGTDRQAQEQ